MSGHERSGRGAKLPTVHSEALTCGIILPPNWRESLFKIEENATPPTVTVDLGIGVGFPVVSYRAAGVKALESKFGIFPQEIPGTGPTH